MPAKFKKVIDALFFGNISYVIRQGSLRPLQFEDMPKLPAQLDPRNVPPRFQSLTLRGPWRFLCDTLAACGSGRFVVLALVGLMIIFGITAPLALHGIVSRIGAAATKGNSLWSGLGLAALFSLLILGRTLAMQHYFYQILKLNQLIINGLNLRVFTKTLKLSRQARGRRAVGDIVNHMGSDTHAVAEFPIVVPEIIYAVGIISLSTLAAWWLVGWPALSALAVLVLVAPLCRYVAGRFVKYDEEVMKHRDDRVSQMSQVISGIRIIKFLTWEDKVIDDVEQIRSGELRARWRLLKTWAGSDVIFGGGRLLANIAALATIIATGGELNPATVFACLALFDLWHHPLSHFSAFISDLAAAKVSAARIMDYLRESETSAEATRPSAPEAPGLCVRNLTARYGAESAPVLKDWNLSLAPGSATAIVGPVGAGKTAFLLTLLQELKADAGSVAWTWPVASPGAVAGSHPRVSYVPQLPYILNDTVNQNIIFGADTPGTTDGAVEAAALGPDLAGMPAGIQTEIGEQGINLSGGQRQRINLARALYADADVILLDDPFSAVDKATEDQIAGNLIFGRLSGKTRIIATHRLEHLASFDHIVFVADGFIMAEGTLDDLLLWSDDFRNFYKNHADVCKHDAPKATPDVNEAGPVTSCGAASGKLTEDEDRAIGEVGPGLYLQYARALGGKGRLRCAGVLALLFGLTGLAGFSGILQNYWLSMWTSPGADTEGWLRSILADFKGDDSRNLMIYAGLAAAGVAITFSRQLLWFARSLQASRTLHLLALQGVIRTVVRFFDRNPVGRILNRFSSDMDSVERNLASSFEQMVFSGANTLVIMVMIISLAPWTVMALIPMIWAFLKLQRLYRCVGRETKRLNSISRSPRYAHFKETIEGLETIRAYRREDKFLDRFYDTLELNQRCFHAMVVANRWFSVRLPLLTGFVTLVAVSGLIVAAQNSMINAGLAAMLMFLNFSLTDHLIWAVRSFSEAEAWMTALERLNRYGALTPEQDVLVVQDTAPKTAGGMAVEFDKFVARYAPELPPALKGVDLVIPRGAKVGVMGRTGSGKSSLIQALYRMIDGESGSIRLGGRDIRTIPLQELRRSLAIIPQSPTLFLGTIRDNLDRYREHQDERIWEVLKQVQMNGHVERLEDQLDAPVTENGNNFSLGQRQLLCLARALLSPAPVIIMDEATASVDVATDQLIHETIRTAFHDRTMLIVAHRLGTISHCDMIVTMKDGVVSHIDWKRIEFGNQLRTPVRPRRPTEPRVHLS